MNLADSARPLAHNKQRQSKDFFPYQQHNARVIHSPYIEFFCRQEDCVQCWQTEAIPNTCNWPASSSSYFSYSGRATGEFYKNTPNNDFSTLRPISTSSVLIDSAQQVDKNISPKISKFLFRGAIGEFSKDLPPNNILIVQRIFTCNIPIDSAWYVEKCGNITICPYFILGANV
jgi:hypothetical protein